jgi:2-dehydro-3-deoxy-D-arabinonate dehydratase
MQLYKTTSGNYLLKENQAFFIEGEWDTLINQKNLYGYLEGLTSHAKKVNQQDFHAVMSSGHLPPVGSQELWAAGVTYLRSRDARMEESKDSGGADCYQKVYDADRPELFFKALPHRIAGNGQEVYIRKDSTWNVPEPELTLFINSDGNIQGYTIGNDMSSRSIEGENPLYLPQAKIYERSAALGPCLYIPNEPLSKDTKISLEIKRAGQQGFSGSVMLNRMKREPSELAAYLFKGCDFPSGCFLMTGTGVVPPDHFTLEKGDEIIISIDNIGSLVNYVGIK